MFTGIVKYVGTLRSAERSSSGLRLRIDCPAAARQLEPDDSICVAGVCLTVTGRDEAAFGVDVVPETLSRTTLGTAPAGTRLNLEPAATLATALGGHRVQGHVDATTELISRAEVGDGARLAFRLPPEVARYVVTKGFITLDGVSLTVAAVAPDRFEIALIPHTASHTSLGALQPGAGVNVEVDVIAKYVERLLQEKREKEEKS